MPSNFTANYNLSQWERTDKVQMEDFNADNAKIDAAIKAGADARAALQAALAKKGNCSIGLFTYTGNGQYGQDHPTRISFPRKPAAFIVFSGEGFLFGQGGDSHVVVLSSTVSSGYVYNTRSVATWSGTTVSFFATDALAKFQLNSSGVIHYVLAFYNES